MTYHLEYQTGNKKGGWSPPPKVLPAPKVLPVSTTVLTGKKKGGFCFIIVAIILLEG